MAHSCSSSADLVIKTGREVKANFALTSHHFYDQIGKTRAAIGRAAMISHSYIIILYARSYQGSTPLGAWFPGISGLRHPIHHFPEFPETAREWFTINSSLAIYYAKFSIKVLSAFCDYAWTVLARMRTGKGILPV